MPSRPLTPQSADAKLRHYQTLVPRARKLGLELHVGTGAGTEAVVLPILAHSPESLSSDDPAQLLRILKEIRGAR